MFLKYKKLEGFKLLYNLLLSLKCKGYNKFQFKVKLFNNMKDHIIKEHKQLIELILDKKPLTMMNQLKKTNAVDLYVGVFLLS